MAFFTEPEPPRGQAVEVLPGIRRIVARNPSVMTYHGTNTFLIEDDDGLTVLDPGPDDTRHVQDILRACGTAVPARIVLTHTHGDHWGAAAALQGATGAAVHGYKHSIRMDYAPDRPLDDGDRAGRLIGVYTPGHAGDHLCFEYHSTAGKILFSGDHVMSWASSIVSPPDGNMLAYYRSLELLLQRDDTLYLPGHGPPLPEPRKLVAELLAHRQRREAQLLKELGTQPWVIARLSEKLYAKTDPWLIAAAQRNVLAHLLKLQQEGIVVELPPAAEDTGEPRSAASDKIEVESGGIRARMMQDSLRRFAIRPAA